MSMLPWTPIFCCFFTIRHWCGMRRHFCISIPLCLSLVQALPVFVSLRLFSFHRLRKLTWRLMQTAFGNFGWFSFHF